MRATTAGEFAPPRGADLDDPRYYLRNFHTLIDWVEAHHGELLLDSEKVRLAALRALPEPSRCLLVRMVMRSGDLFRQSKLSYAEIGDIAAAQAPLIQEGWVEQDPSIGIAEFCSLVTRPELSNAFQSELASLPASAKKADQSALLAERYGMALKPFSHWWPESGDRLFRLTDDSLLTRLRLLFFGNLSQDWSTFVLTELGHHRYEAVDFSADSRAFAARDEVDHYLRLHALRDALEQEVAYSEIYNALPSAPENDWLQSRQSRLVFQIARQAERAGDTEFAAQLYARSNHREALIRRFRVLEKTSPSGETLRALREHLDGPLRPETLEALERIEQRLARKLGEKKKSARKTDNLPRLDLTLPASSYVEAAVAEHLGNDQAPCLHVENSLINGLFALLCWDVLYAPLPGAFFHPFHAAPADLNRPDFVERRRDLFEARLNTLNSGEYTNLIRKNLGAKWGTTNRFVHWGLLTEELVDLALSCIPAQDLDVCFRRLLEDIPAHRSGLPDLVQFFPAERRYRLIEVKGPGDRLQDHQRRWLNFCLARGMDVSVCYVRWSDQSLTGEGDI
ncbi:VRR-NUC domain-containing protein [Marinobacterium sp. YM272]|uniref:VRR-NUC domain-containing protein n=1 Tax=Marinobacterium sp. YM272 TaxID=3421654 RepID=UPI003D7F7F58